MIKDNKALSAQGLPVAPTESENKSRINSTLNERNVDWLSNELKTHQIELEMQNEELHRQRDKAEFYAKKYSDMYNNASSCQFTLSREGEILESNLYGAELLKKAQSGLNLSRFGFFVDDSSKGVFNDFLDHVFAGNTRETCEVKLLIENEASKYIQISGILSLEREVCHITVTDISGLKQVKHDLQKIASVLDAAFESVHNGILVVSDQGRILKSNARFAEMWHLSDEIVKSVDDELVMNSILIQLVNPDEFVALVRSLYTYPDKDSLDIINFKDGRVFERISKPLYLYDKPYGRVWSFLDITENVRSKEVISLANWKLESIIEGTHIGTWEWNVQTGETAYNEEWVRMIGYTLDELAPATIKTSEELTHPEDLKKSNELLERHFSGELPYYNCECRIRHKMGHWVWILDRGRITNRTRDGKPLMMFGTHSDITDRKRIQEALIASEKEANALITALPDMMFVLDSHGVFVDYKSATEDLSYQTESIIGKNIRDILPPEFTDLIEGKMALIAQSGEMELFEYDLEVPIKGKRSYEARMVHGGNNEYITIVRDISDRKIAEELIRSSNEQLQKVNAEKDKFFSIIAHDLRGPFNGFLGLTEIMADDSEEISSEELQTIALAMRNSARNVFKLLENLLEWARMEQGLIPFSPISLNLSALLSECLKPLQESLNRKKITIMLNVSADFNVMADPYMIAAVIRNLISNAIKFSQKESEIFISAVLKKDDCIEISVKDSGIGMNPEMAAHLFELYAKNGRKGTAGEPSTGLGLIICKEFVKKHLGSIWVESAETKGSTFYFTLPKI